MVEPAVIELDDPVVPIVDDTNNPDVPGGDPPDGDDQSPPVVSDDDSAPPDDVTDPPAQKKGGVQKRIDSLTAARNKAKEDAAYWRGIAEGKASNSEPATPPKEEKGLSRDDFDTEEEYLDARVDQRIDAKAKTSTGTSARDKMAGIQAQYDGGREKHEDFDEVALDPTLTVNAYMLEAAQGESLPDILYHLGKDRDLAKRISLMPPMQAAKEIGKIETKITGGKSPPTKPKPSKAPAPVPKVKPGGPTPVKTAKGTQKANFDVWEKKRREDLGVK